MQVGQSSQLIEVVKATIQVLNKQNVPVTPNRYAKEFVRQSASIKDDLQELIELENAIKSSVKTYNFKNQDITTYHELAQEIIEHTRNFNNLNFLAASLKECLAPSIDDAINERLEEFLEIIEKKPVELLEARNIEKLKSISKQRILLDKDIVKRKAVDIGKLTQLMVKYFNKSLLQSGNSLEEINNIKSELDDLELSTASKRELMQFQSKLIDSIYNLGYTLEATQEEIKQNRTKFLVMQEHIEKLQKDLDKERKESNVDFLTGLLNRRAYGFEIEKIEKQFQIFGNKYAIAFLDIDRFKSINDNHGHDCGDTILKTFAKLLSALMRAGDLIVRYGGEEFVAIVMYNEKDEIKKYAQRIKRIIKENSFVHGDLKFKVTFSGGIACRENFDNYEDALLRADELMYEAKNSGRDKIKFDDNEEV